MKAKLRDRLGDAVEQYKSRIGGAQRLLTGTTILRYSPLTMQHFMNYDCAAHLREIEPVETLRGKR